MRPYLAVEGPIGVGKTTLAGWLCQALDATPMLETYEDNPFLPAFYADPACHALPLQLHFLLARYQQHQAVDGDDLLVSDYVFAKNDLFARANLDGPSLALYEQISGALASQLVVPSLVVLLDADLDVLMARIAARGRPYEQRDTMRPYMAKLVEEYRTFFDGYSAAPVLHVDTTHIDALHDPAARRALVQHVIGAFRATPGGQSPRPQRML